MAILVVDDDEEYLNYISKALTPLGHTPTLVSSGEAAYKELDNCKYSLILTDLRMPGITGLQLLESARRIDPLTVTIVMTAYASTDSAMEAIRLGAYDYLPKPSGVDVIQASVRRGLEYYELRRALIERNVQMEKFKRESQETVKFIQEISSQLRNTLGVVKDCSSLITETGGKPLDPLDEAASLLLIKENTQLMSAILDDLDSRHGA